jgi:hypothetical protein
MAIEQLRAGGIGDAAAAPEDTGPTTWAAKWDMWWYRTAAAGWILVVIVTLFHLERSISTSSLELKLEIAAPLFFGASAAFEVLKARRDKRIEKRLADQVLMSILFILWFTYFGMTELRHLPR